jgi:outer membrane immunogenic protein
MLPCHSVLDGLCCFAQVSKGHPMKKMALGIAAFAALIGPPAVGADMPVKAPRAAPPYAWSGCYLGANAGWIGGDDRYALSPSGSYLNPVGALPPPNPAGTGDFAADITALTTSYSNQGSGGLVGGQFGCNLQTGQFVIGGEVDGQWSSLKTSINAAYPAVPNAGNALFTDPARTEQASSSLQGLFTLRGRMGQSWDRLLLYATGGLAFGEIKSQTNVTFATAGGFPVFNGASHIGSATAGRTGWVVGGGAEYAFAPKWSMKAEFLFIDLGTFTYNSPLVAAATPGAVGAGYSWSTKIREHDEVARVGLNYRLN